MGSDHFRCRATAELNVCGNHRLHHGGAAGNVDDLHIETVLFKQPDFLGEMVDLFTRPDAAIAQYDLLDSLTVGRRQEKKCYSQQACKTNTHRSSPISVSNGRHIERDVPLPELV